MLPKTSRVSNPCESECLAKTEQTISAIPGLDNHDIKANLSSQKDGKKVSFLLMKAVSSRKPSYRSAWNTYLDIYLKLKSCE